jgi:hypothetical protein
MTDEGLPRRCFCRVSKKGSLVRKCSMYRSWSLCISRAVWRVDQQGGHFRMPWDSLLECVTLTLNVHREVIKVVHL